MGYLRHHSIIVTGTYGDWIEKVHEKAKIIFPHISEILDVNLNSTRSFFIPPDGSKEEWPNSREGDLQRDAFIAYLNSLRDEDNSSSLQWVEVFFGDDNYESGIVREVNSKNGKDGG